VSALTGRIERAGSRHVGQRLGLGTSRADDSRTRLGEGNHFRDGFDRFAPNRGMGSVVVVATTWCMGRGGPATGAWTNVAYPDQAVFVRPARGGNQGGEQHRKFVHAMYRPFADSGPPLPERGERANGLRCRHVGVAIRGAMSYALGRGHRVWPHSPLISWPHVVRT